MPGGEYEPKDSRDVTLKPNAPGKPSGWRETEAREQDKPPAADPRLRDPDARPPRGVPQAHPVSAEEAAGDAAEDTIRRSD